MKQRLMTLTLLVTAAVAAGPAAAQTQRSGGGGEAQKLMQQYQQVAAEKTALQAQLAQAQKDLDSAQAELAAARKERDGLKAHQGEAVAAVAQLSASKDAADRSVEQYRQRLAELTSRFRETAATLKEAEADRAQLHRTLDERNATFDQCAENNLQLYELTDAVLDRYEHVGLFTQVGASEPFTKITRTRIGNLVDETRARAEELRVGKRSTQ
jgi:chromosome segregation ATPase